LYVVQSHDGRPRQVYVPKEWEERIRRAVQNHQEMQTLIEGLSELEWKRLRRERSKAVLRRLIRYSEKVFELSGRVLSGISDGRLQPRIRTPVLVQSALILF